MFKSAATKIAHNTTLPALAGNSDLRPLQDLIIAEKTVLTSLQKLRVDLLKAGDSLRIWGQGEGDDLGDILTASSKIMSHFAAAVSTYSSLHHSIRDSMKSVRTREEALDDLRRRRRRVGASAETAEKKLNKMSPEHKNLGVQTDTLNKLREEMRAMDGEIVREEAELGDYKRKCAKDWMAFKLGGLVECCEKGLIVGEVGRQVIQFIPEDVTQPGFPRAYYNAHGPVGNLVAEVERAVSQVSFSGNPSGRIPTVTSVPQPLPRITEHEHEPAQSPFLPTPSLGSELTLGAYSPPPGPPPVNRRASADELGIVGHVAPQYASLPTSANRDRERALASSSQGPPRPISLPAPHNSGVPQTEENQSLMASIADALSQSHRGFTLDEATSLGHHAPDEPVPKYEVIAGTVGRSAQSEPHAPTSNGYVCSPPLSQEGERMPRRATRRSTSPPNLPPGAAPAAIRAWDDRMGQGEDGAHSDRPASSSARVPSQRPISSSERDGEEEDDLACDHDRRSSEEEEARGVDGKHRVEDTSFSERGRRANPSTNTADQDDHVSTPIQKTVPMDTEFNTDSGATLSRAGSKLRIPRVPPPAVGEDMSHSAHDRQSVHSTRLGGQEDQDDTRTDESADERARSAAAVREVSRELDALAFTAAIPPSSAYATPKGPPPGYRIPSPQTQYASSSGRTPYSSVPSSPILPPPNPPFANRDTSMIETRHVRGHHPTSSESMLNRMSPTTTDGHAAALTAPRSTSPIYRTPPAEYARPAPPFSSPLMARSTSSLNSTGGTPSPTSAPRTISAAAFRRQQMRSPSGYEHGPADTSPLMPRKPSGSPLPPMSRQPATGSAPSSAGPSKGRLSVVNPDPRMSDEELDRRGDEVDYIGAYGGESAGYGAGKYVSDLERH